MKTHYIGMEGLTITKICMVGRVKIGSEVFEAFTRLFPIREGKTVKIVGVYMNQLIIEPMD